MRKTRTRKLGTALTLLLATGAIPALAQIAGSAPAAAAAAPAPVQQGTRLILLGTGGGPVMRSLRGQPGNLLVVNGHPYLIDSGEGTTRQVKKAGFNVSDITTVFLTHLHIDHTAGLASLFAFYWIPGPHTPMQVYGPPGTAALVKGALDFLSVPVSVFLPEFPPNYPKIAQLIQPHEIDITAKTLIYHDDNIKVYAVDNNHYVTFQNRIGKPPYGDLRTYAYRFETPDRTIVFTGDTGPSQAVNDLAKGADILVSEVIDTNATIAYMKQQFHATDAQLKPLIAHQEKEHLTPEEVGKMAAAAGVKMVVLTHISPGLDSELNSLQYTAGVRKYYKGPVVEGQDLEQF